MSKVEVKVRPGDRFIAWCGNLYLARTGKIIRRICSDGRFLNDTSVPDCISMESTTLPDPAARAWIESLGGTVVEEREEEPAVVVGYADEVGDVNYVLQGSEAERHYLANARKYIRVPGVTG